MKELPHNVTVLAVYRADRRRRADRRKARLQLAFARYMARLWAEGRAERDKQLERYRIEFDNGMDQFRAEVAALRSEMRSFVSDLFREVDKRKDPHQAGS